MLCSLVSIYFNSCKLSIQSRLLIQRYSQFWFVRKKSLGIISPPHFAYDLSRKMLLWLYSINWLNFIVWLPLLLEILGAIICQQCCVVINFKIKLVFLIKQFFYMTKKSRKILKYFEYKKSSYSDTKSNFSSILKGFHCL